MVGPLLSRDDLDELSDTAAAAEEPRAVAAELVEVARAGRLADPADTGYAYLLAAEIHERADELSQAVALADRALTAYRSADRPASRSADRSADRPADRPAGQQLGQLRAYRARLLLQLGREQEGMAELAELRALMVTDPRAAAYVPEALEAGGRTEVALQWLDEALAERATGGASGRVIDQLAATRDRIGPAVETTPDRYQPDEDLDEDLSETRADELDEGQYQDKSYQPGGDGDAVLLVWPLAAYEQVDQRWPEVLEPTGAESWDEYRRYCQAVISTWSRRGRAPLYQVNGDADGFEEWLTDQGADPYHANLVALARDYGDYLAEQGDPAELPPGRDDPCWCGSGVSYARCCLPLS